MRSTYNIYVEEDINVEREMTKEKRRIVTENARRIRRRRGFCSCVI